MSPEKRKQRAKDKAKKNRLKKEKTRVDADGNRVWKLSKAWLKELTLPSHMR